MHPVRSAADDANMFSCPLEDCTQPVTETVQRRIATNSIIVMGRERSTFHTCYPTSLFGSHGPVSVEPPLGTSTWRPGHQISGESVQDTDIISVNERKADTTARRWSCGADLLSKTDKITAFKKTAPGLGSSPNLQGEIVFR